MSTKSTSGSRTYYLIFIFVVGCAAFAGFWSAGAPLAIALIGTTSISLLSVLIGMAVKPSEPFAISGPRVFGICLIGVAAVGAGIAIRVAHHR